MFIYENFLRPSFKQLGAQANNIPAVKSALEKVDEFVVGSPSALPPVFCCATSHVGRIANLRTCLPSEILCLNVCPIILESDMSEIMAAILLCLSIRKHQLHPFFDLV